MTGLDSLFDPSSVSGWDLFWAVLCAAAGWVASIFIARAVATLLRKTPNVTETAAVVSARVVKYAVILTGVGVGLSFLGASLRPLLVIALIVAAVIGLALRGIADNFAAGVVLQTRHPITLGNEIEVDGICGVVVELNGRSVVLHTNDGRTVRVPNGLLMSRQIINHSERGSRRSEVQVRLQHPPESMLDVLACLTEAAMSVTGVHPHEAASAHAISVSPDRAIVRVRFWHDPLDRAPVTSRVVLALSRSIVAHGYSGLVTSDPGDPPLIPSEEI